MLCGNFSFQHNPLLYPMMSRENLRNKCCDVYTATGTGYFRKEISPTGDAEPDPEETPSRTWDFRDGIHLLLVTVSRCHGEEQAIPSNPSAIPTSGEAGVSGETPRPYHPAVSKNAVVKFRSNV